MANFDNTKLVNAQAKVLSDWQNGIFKYTNPSTYLSILGQSPAFYVGYEALRTREDRVLQAAYFKRTSGELTTARTHNHTGVYGDTDILTPSWTTYARNIAYTLKQGNNNVFSLDEMINAGIANECRNFAEGLESIATDFIFNNRSGVNTAVVGGEFDSDTDTFKIGMLDEKKVGMTIQSIMQVNKYNGGGLIVYCDTVLYNKVWFYSNQGTGNSENLAFGFGGVTWIHSVKLNTLASAIGYTNGYGVAVQSGLIGVLPHIPKENVLGVETKVNSYGSLLNPIDGLSYAIHTYETTADGSSVGGYTQDVITQVQMSIDMAFDACPLVGDETPLQAFGLVETANN